MLTDILLRSPQLARVIMYLIIRIVETNNINLTEQSYKQLQQSYFHHMIHMIISHAGITQIAAETGIDR